MILKNCRLIPELCEGFEQELADIRIESKKIAEILPAGGDYAGEEVIDIAGKTVIPGMYNCHVHMGLFQNSFTNLNACTHDEYIFHSINYAQELLSYGFTTIRDCGGVDNVNIDVRNAINAGLIQGPNVLACGNIITPDFAGSAYIPFYTASERHSHPFRGSEDALPFVREYVARGADFIKLTTTSNKAKIKQSVDQVGKFLFTPEEIKAIREACNKEEVPLACHSTCPESHDAVIEAGADTMEHGLYMTQENVDKIIAKGNKTAYIPTLAVSYVGFKKGWPTYDDTHNGAGNAVRMCHDAGVLVGFGTDDFQKDFRKFPAVEFVARSEFGIPNIDIIKQATINSAIAMGVGKKKGTIAVGKVADLAVFDGKPDEDLMAFNVKAAYVFKNGNMVVDHGIVTNAGVK
ncbi:MAG: amidohydrolase family protein [Coriobacteriaceae bacterium]|nr:amidohydrolase family protein [Coriobacteriaceae bacterium]